MGIMSFSILYEEKKKKMRAMRLEHAKVTHTMTWGHGGGIVSFTHLNMPPLHLSEGG